MNGDQGSEAEMERKKNKKGLDGYIDLKQGRESKMSKRRFQGAHSTVREPCLVEVILQAGRERCHTI